MIATTQVRERGLLFSSPMMNALLDGRKTMTRRPIKAFIPRAAEFGYTAFTPPGHISVRGYADGGAYGEWFIKLPFRVGDRFYAKESWHPRVAHSHGEDACDCGDIVIRYASDQKERFISDWDLCKADPDNKWEMPSRAKWGYVSPLFMPKWAARYWGEVTSVRAERVQDISEEDARAEGIGEFAFRLEDCPLSLGYATHDDGKNMLYPTARRAFEVLWNTIHGEGDFGINPFVWAITFKRVEVGHAS